MTNKQDIEAHRNSNSYRFMRWLIEDQQGEAYVCDCLKEIERAGYQPDGRWGSDSWLLNLAEMFAVEIRGRKVYPSATGMKHVMRAYPELLG